MRPVGKVENGVPKRDPHGFQGFPQKGEVRW